MFLTISRSDHCPVYIVLNVNFAELSSSKLAPDEAYSINEQHHKKRHKQTRLSFEVAGKTGMFDTSVNRPSISRRKLPDITNFFSTTVKPGRDAKPSIANSAHKAGAEILPDTALLPQSLHDPSRQLVKDNWKAILAKPNPPLCSGHSRPSKYMVTKKSGLNKGRAFWMCSE